MPCQEFIKNSMIHESLFVGYVWNNPKLYRKYKEYQITKYEEDTNEGTMTIEMWYFFYELGRKMVEKGIQKFNDTTVYSFVSSQPESQDFSWMKKYNEYGGFGTIHQLMQECQEDDNNDTYHISEIQKYELLRYYENIGLLNAEHDTIKKGKKIKLKDLLCKMTLENIKSYFRFYINKGNQASGSNNIKLSNLSDGLEDSIADFDKGQSMGLSLHNSPRLNRIIKGWKKGDFIYLILSSGVGKSTFTQSKCVLGMYESDEKCINFVNEENKKRAHHTLISTVSGSITGYPISRERLSQGHFGKEELFQIEEAKKWILSKPSNQVKMGEIEKFLLTDVIDTIEMYKSLGYNYMVLDTFKPDASKTDVARWEKFSRHAQDLFDCIKPSANNIGCWATLQLKIGSEHKYLDLDCIGKALETVEVADKILMGRLLFEDEYPDGRNPLVVYDYVEDSIMGWTKEEVVLDKDKEYMILFIPKNRDGGKSQQVIYEVEYDTNQWTEVGYTNMKKSARK